MKIEDITVEQFIKLQHLNEQELSDADKLAQFSDIFNIKSVKGVKEFSENITNLLKKDVKLIKTFKFEGVEYGFIPSLEDISTDEYVDLSHYQSDNSQFHRLLSILYRPIVTKNKDLYTIEEYNGTKNAEIMLKVPCTILIGCIGFFLHLCQTFLKDSLLFLKMEKQKTMEMLMKK